MALGDKHTDTIRCPQCGKGGVTGTLTIRTTRALSAVTYPRHSSASGHTTKKCPQGVIIYGSTAYPVWAKKLLGGIPEN